MSLLPFISVRSAGSGTPTVPSANIGATIETIIADPGGTNQYQGFPQGAKLATGGILSMYKSAPGHADTGPLMFKTSTDGGTSWNEGQVTIGGTPIECSALIMSVLSTGRILVVYQDNDGNVQNTYTFVKVCYSDDEGLNWSQGDTFNFTNGLYVSSILGRPKELPDGTVLIPYYQIPQTGSGLGSINAILETTDGGDTLTQGSVIRAKPGGTSPDPFQQITSELGWEIVETDGTRAGTSIVGLLRNEETQYHTWVCSTDGGVTWDEDEVAFMYAFDSGFFPVDLIAFGGLIYIIAGKRDFSPSFVGTLEYCTVSVADILNNTGYSATVVVDYTPYANTLGSGEGIDWGYASAFIDHHGELIVHFYDSSPSSTGVDSRCMIYQLPLLA